MEFLLPGTTTFAEDMKAKGLDEAYLGIFLSFGIPVVILEALVWTIAPIELSARFAKSTLIGAALGLLGFVAFHWRGGLEAMMGSGWVVLVLNTSYLVLRPRSRRVAIWSTVGQKLAFILVVSFAIYPSGF